MKYSTISFNSIWSSVQSKLPKNVFNFSIRYINNTLPTRKNLLRWGISPTSECTFCLEPETLLHVVAGCKTYLNEGRFTWRHTRKRQKYEELIDEQHKYYEKVKFVNLSISSLGVFSHSSLSFIGMLKDLNFDDKCRKYFVRKIINTCIRSSYYVFCKRNKEWDNPLLMPY